MYKPKHIYMLKKLLITCCLAFLGLSAFPTFADGDGDETIIILETDPSPDPQTIIEPVLDMFYYYEDPFVREYSMNWGWGQAYDNGWYTTTGSWVAGSDAFDYYKKMIADFTEIE